MKLLVEPVIRPLNKDAILDDLQRKLQATEYQLGIHKEDMLRYRQMAYDYWCELQSQDLE